MLLLSSIVFVLSCVSVLLISMFAGHGWNIMCMTHVCSLVWMVNISMWRWWRVKDGWCLMYHTRHRLNNLLLPCADKHIHILSLSLSLSLSIIPYHTNSTNKLLKNAACCCFCCCTMLLVNLLRSLWNPLWVYSLYVCRATLVNRGFLSLPRAQNQIYPIY